ncbi:MAG TPA: hypothetical protein VE133_17650 [Candidatus Sulfotelmatobacter sp.]|nr:hypothetical protein [Candidatus Sulfotelmatobacter sp.]
MAIALSFVVFLRVPGERAILWVSLLLVLPALFFAIVGVKRAFGQPQVYKGKVSSSILGVLVLAACALTVFGWFEARLLPATGAAPQVGQKVPDFILADTQGNKVSLTQLLGHGDAAQTNGAAPKAVLLVFYRGYW